MFMLGVVSTRTGSNPASRVEEMASAGDVWPGSPVSSPCGTSDVLGMKFRKNASNVLSSTPSAFAQMTCRPSAETTASKTSSAFR